MGNAPTFDSDGDLVVGQGSAGLFLRIIDRDAPLPLIRVFGIVVRGVKATSELVGDLNEANRNFYFVRFLWADDCIHIDGFIPAVSLTVHELALVLRESITAADHFDTLFVGRHGGSLIARDAGEVVDA
jgi:type III secretion system-like peptide-binding chaperone